MTQDILIVDDEADIRNLVRGILEDESFETRVAETSAQAYAHIEEKPPGLIVLDIWLQGSEHDGMQILERVSETHSDIPVIMISGHGTIETAVAAIKLGAYDFIEKPFKADRLLLMVQRGMENAALKRENSALKKQAKAPLELIGASPFAKSLRDVLKRVAPTNSRVLLSGEAGTGKAMMARVLHQNSARADLPFITLNCASFQGDALEAALFGSEDGDAVHKGALEDAQGGTLLLDEITAMPVEMQSKLLGVFQGQSFQRLGGARPVSCDVRILASSNRNLEKAIEAGELREDLYFRLNVVPIEMAALRTRGQDIEPLATHFLARFCDNAGVGVKSFSKEVLGKFSGYAWPGNARQLKNVVEWMMIMHGDADVFTLDHLPPELLGQVAHISQDAGDVIGVVNTDLLEMPLREARECFERDYLFSQVERFEGNISKTAQFIGMERSALHRKLKSLQKMEDEEVSSVQHQKQRA